jgi:hypothetical protein
MSTTRKSKHVRFTPEDWQIIAELKRYHGITSDNEVIRMALRAAKRELSPTQPPKQGLAIPPHDEHGQGSPGSV